MTRAERAKQFMPFDSMKGLGEALRRREEKILRGPRRSLSEEEERKLDRELRRLEPGDIVQIRFFAGGRDQSYRGRVREVRPEEGRILFEEAGTSCFIEDLYEIRPVPERESL